MVRSLADRTFRLSAFDRVPALHKPVPPAEEQRVAFRHAESGLPGRRAEHAGEAAAQRGLRHLNLRSEVNYFE